MGHSLLIEQQTDLTSCRHGAKRRLVASSLCVFAFVTGCATTPTTDHPLEYSVTAAIATPPGAVSGDVTQVNIHQTICVPGWTASVRPSTTYTNGVKAKLLRAHGLSTADASKYELDHFIPLALGGHPRKPENLW